MTRSNKAPAGKTTDSSREAVSSARKCALDAAMPADENLLFRLSGHFSTITRHKIEVTRLCIACGIPRQGLVHDLSKYHPSEFIRGVHYYQGIRSPNAAEREDRGFSEAWLHHKGRNKHHFEYWVDIPGPNGENLSAVPMPTRYIVEMFCDRVAACKVYQGCKYTDKSPLAYFNLREKSGIMHLDTAAQLEKLLTMLSMRGERYTVRYIRRYIVGPRYSEGDHGRF